MRWLRQGRRRTVLEAVGSIALVVLAAQPSQAADPPSAPTPTEAAASFYRTVLELRVLGVPGEADRKRLAPQLSPGLTDLLAKADAAEAAYRDATRNEVPPIIQGDLFSSLFEGATGLGAVTCEGSGDRAVCTVELRYEQAGQEEANPGVTSWKDRVTLVPAPPGGAAGWVVDDIEYGGDWQFMHKGTLRRILENVIKSGHEEAARAKEESLLHGGWVYVSGETDFEQISFDVEDGRQVFRSWLHERPEMVAQWTRDGDALTIYAPDGTTREIRIAAVNETTLELRFADAAEKAVFRRPQVAPPAASAAPAP
jgi:hypothetical protein